MEFDILDSLEALGYPHLTDDDSAKAIIREGLKSLEFYKLVAWLSKELQALYQLESCVNTVSDLEDECSFLVEVNTFLRELECPYDCLTSVPIAEALKERKNRAIMLDYLCSELMCARMAVTKQQKKKRALDIEVGTSPAAACISSIMKTLNMDMDSAKMEVDSTGDGSKLLEAIAGQIKAKVSEHPEVIEEPLLKEELSETQWEEVEECRCSLHEEYEARREMLLTRFDVVAQSFKWGERMKGKEEEITKVYQPARKEMKSCPDVELADIIAARKDLTKIEKASCAAVRKNTVSELNRLVIGDVPDRGGRPNEQRPPVEMPVWKKRTESQDGGNFRGRGRGGYRGSGGHNRDKAFHKGAKTSSQSRESGAFDAMGSYGSN